MAGFNLRSIILLVVLAWTNLSYANSKCYVAKYDDLTPQTGVPLDTTFTYKYLNYSMFYVGSTSSLDGVRAQSPNNTVNFRVSDGTPHTLSPVSPYSTFNFYNFYFGCVQFTGENVVVLPLSCVVNVYGTLPDGNITGVQTVSYFAENNVATGMYFAQLVPILGVTSIHLGVPASGSTPTLTIPKFDNVYYCLN